MKNKLTIIMIIFAFLTFVYLINPNISYRQSNIFKTAPIYAEDDDHEEEEEDEEDEDESEDYENESTEVVYETIEPQNGKQVDPKNEQVLNPVATTTIEAGYNIDSDEDKLVDAIDPHPLIAENLFFTDSDGDTVSDALDKYPNEDDLFYMDFIDTNGNGIADTFE